MILINFVIDQLDAKGIAGENQPLSPDIPNCQAKHPVEMVKNVIAPLCVPVNDDFRIRPGSKHMSEALEFALQLGKIIDFSIEDDPHRFLKVRHGLVATRKVDDRKPSKTKPDRTRDVETFVIGPSVSQAVRHTHDILAKDRGSVAEVKLSADSTHRIC